MFSACHVPVLLLQILLLMECCLLHVTADHLLANPTATERQSQGVLSVPTAQPLHLCSVVSLCNALPAHTLMISFAVLPSFTRPMLLMVIALFQVVVEILLELDVGEFVVKLNHRRLLDAMMDLCGVPPAKFRPICRCAFQQGDHCTAKLAARFRCRLCTCYVCVSLLQPLHAHCKWLDAYAPSASSSALHTKEHC